MAQGRCGSPLANWYDAGMGTNERFSFHPSSDGNSVTVTFSGREGVACRFDLDPGGWTASVAPGGLTVEEAQLLLAKWRAPGSKR
jgi:hypothetical protein